MHGRPALEARLSRSVRFDSWATSAGQVPWWLALGPARATLSAPEMRSTVAEITV